MSSNHVSKVWKSGYDTMINYQLSQKFKLLGNNELNHLTNILTWCICSIECVSRTYLWDGFCVCMCEYLFLLNFDVWFHSPIHIGFHIYIYI
jgi:hypothetical protein